tara:strand:- start:2460 stop:3140 length:681 start_codon:yes stop_codon:yes gene_type:complete
MTHISLLKVKLLIVIVILLIGSCVQIVQGAEVKSIKHDVLTLEMAVKSAQRNDPWPDGNRHTQDAYQSQNIADGTLPDPKVNIGLANMPLDTFDFGQEGMTQFKVDESQMFPHGESLALRQHQLELVASQYPFQREDRKANLAVTSGQLWLDVYKAQESITLIESNRALFEPLSDIDQASYSSALGKSRLQDIVRAQLEVTRIDDRLNVIEQMLDTNIQLGSRGGM